MAPILVDVDSSLDATPPGTGATRTTAEPVLDDDDDDPDEGGMRLCSDGNVTLLPELDDDDPEELDPDEELPDELPPLAVPEDAVPEEELPVVPLRGTACAAATAGTDNPNATAKVVSARIDLVMATAPGPFGPSIQIMTCCKSTATPASK